MENKNHFAREGGRFSKAIGFGCERSQNIKNTDNRSKRKFQRTNQRADNGRAISETRFRDVGERVSRRFGIELKKDG